MTLNHVTIIWIMRVNITKSSLTILTKSPSFKSTYRTSNETQKIENPDFKSPT